MVLPQPGSAPRRPLLPLEVQRPPSSRLSARGGPQPPPLSCAGEEESLRLFSAGTTLTTRTTEKPKLIKNSTFFLISKLLKCLLNLDLLPTIHLCRQSKTNLGNINICRRSNNFTTQIKRVKLGKIGLTTHFSDGYVSQSPGKMKKVGEYTATIHCFNAL